MGRPWEYPRWRRVLMQAVTWLILGGTVGLAQLVIHVKNREALTLGPPVRYGFLLVRFPEGWTVQQVAGSQGPAIAAAEDDELLVVEQWLVPHSPTSGPPSEEQNKGGGSTEKVRFRGLGREGLMQIMHKLRPTSDSMVAEEYLTAAVVVPLGRRDLAILVELRAVGPRVGHGERQLLLAVVNSVVLAPGVKRGQTSAPVADGHAPENTEP